MDGLALLKWQLDLVARLEGALRRKLVAADFDCIVWNTAGEAMRVEAMPLLKELRARNLTSNIFRSQGKLRSKSLGK
ncbi:MAG TPA: hypothetical protein VGP94_15365 [Tepidisphaeraceae bacterium]|jgi:hypothetical protein|nr:hypothetical protein [Tepidisphaeraceae bacterium]